MKYEDDELAEAALLLAHEASPEKMPAALEKSIEARGAAALANRPQLTTTRAAAVAIEDEPRRLAPPTRLRDWAPWLVAAACFALVVYQWRLSSLHRDGPAQASAAAVFASPLKDGAGKVVAWFRSPKPGADREIEIVSSLAGAPGERYRIFATESDPARAVSVGEFRCVDDCSGKRITLPTIPAWSKGRVLLTRHPSDLLTWTAETTVLAEGTWPADAPPR